MSTAPSNDPNGKYVPPDPGGRSRYLIRCVAIACAVLAVIVVILMVVLHSAAPKPVPQQQPANNGNSSLGVAGNGWNG